MDKYYERRRETINRLIEDLSRTSKTDPEYTKKMDILIRLMDIELRESSSFEENTRAYEQNVLESERIKIEKNKAVAGTGLSAVTILISTIIGLKAIKREDDGESFLKLTSREPVQEIMKFLARPLKHVF